MAVQELAERLGARNHPTKSGWIVPCTMCGAETYLKPHDMRQRAERAKAGFQKSVPTAGNVYCSAKCRQVSASTARITLRCTTCDVEFQRPRSQAAGRHTFCSRPCADAFGVVQANCAWPGCDQQVRVRRYVLRQRGVERIFYKRKLHRGVGVHRHPLCEHHVQYWTDHYGELGRRAPAWFCDPATDLGTRGMTSAIARLLIFEKSKGRCAGCQTELEYRRSKNDWHVDHITPVFRGGLTNYDNLQALCIPCHDAKSRLEKGEATRRRHADHRARRWLTHPQKDALIAELRAEIERLRSEIEREGNSRCPRS